ncbi:dienelactone hydrolase family protein [Novosphingobium flavum]|uniref:Dienelactone hydrolase family protein n=1 Tax=Novosphingobium flavum TaxID=1778672 RepID=A0A7X1KK83_9SPHN|nr:dienelactone hydrolase family protein [Novosphingobium flavum]MBC2663915.1 dienelactone hydrolase family protein [Novosphingobium flavum]
MPMPDAARYAALPLAAILLAVAAAPAPAWADQAAVPVSAPASVTAPTEPVDRDEQLLAKTKAGTLVLDEVIEIEDRLGSDQWRAAKLANSTRLRRDVTITRAGKTLGGLVVFPDKRGPAPVILMVPEDQGLNRWGRLMADELAALGYIVVAPDFHYGLAPNGGGASDYPDYKTVFYTHRATKRDNVEMTADMNAWADYAKTLPGFNGKMAGVGFAWGAGRVFNFAVQRKDLTAAFIFYDAAPPPEKLAGLTAPVYGFYAEYDPRVTRSLEATRSAMKRLGKKYEEVVYPGSEHMFVRLGEEPRNRNPANTLARNKALARLQELLAAM